MIEENQERLLLDFESMTMVGDLVAGLVDSEYNRIVTEDTRVVVVSFLYEFYYQHRLHTLFVAGTLRALTETVLSNEAIRDFVLNLTDHLSIYLSTTEGLPNRLIATLVDGICRNKVNAANNPAVFLDQRTSDAIYVNPDPLELVLKNNFWIVCLVLVYLALPRTKFFSADTNPKAFAQ